MVNAQTWLDNKYPRDRRNQITELKISEKNLERDLKLEGFVNLKKLNCAMNKLTNLDLSDCDNLRNLDCYDNQLTNLNLTNLVKIETVWCHNNYLTQINYPTFDPSNYRQLSALNLNDNNFASQDLTIFSSFTNLIHLYIGNEDWKRINQGTYNRFNGSLEALQSLKRLVVLDIRNTDINSGVEYLPSSVSLIKYSSRERLNSKVKEISWQLSLRENKTQSEWEIFNFTLPEVKSWMEVGLKANDYDLANYLKNEKNLSPFEARGKLKSLRSEFENRFQAQIETSLSKKD